MTGIKRAGLRTQPAERTTAKSSILPIAGADADIGGADVPGDETRAIRLTERIAAERALRHPADQDLPCCGSWHHFGLRRPPRWWPGVYAASFTCPAIGTDGP